MKTTHRFFAVFAMLILSATSAFAIDQVTTTSGEVVEGTVLNDVPNRHVDLRLMNGTTRRFQRSEVASVDRDVPSTHDRSMYGNQSFGFLSLLAGGYYNLGGSGSTVLFDYGIKVGVAPAQLGDFARLGFALNFDRNSHSETGTLGGATLEATQAINDLNLQILFMRMGNSGFYFGPNAGIAIIASSLRDTATGASAPIPTETKFEAGAQLGYEIFLSDSFSIGPEFRFEHIFTENGNLIKFLLAGNIHF